MAIFGTLGENDLSAISASIADTAVDVFVYDTSKDSDGGAWRKRTQNTSWYNETLNTSTRGSRKEFPAVAVIVAEGGKVTIYDGDDPDLPMWMKFHSDGGNCMIRNSGVISSVTMLNAELCVGKTTGSKGLGQISFITEVGKTIRRNGSGYLYIYKGNIEQRNDSLEYTNTGDITQQITGDLVYDVAMTVLPNALIDSATGLPIPTIAVATDGGLSIINDDGTVSSPLSGTHAGSTIDISDDFILYYGNESQGGYYPYDVKTATYIDNARFFGTAIDGPLCLLNNISSSTNQDIAFTGDDGQSLAIGMDNGLNLINGDPRNGISDNGMIAYIASDYNTGYQYGDIKGAFLSNTDTTNAVAGELHPNGNSDFSSTDVSYISNTASGTASVSGGQLILSGGTANYSDHIINITTEVGQQYVITIDYVTNSGSNGSIGMYANNAYLTEANDGNSYTARSTGNTYVWYFTANASSETIDLVTAGAAANTYTFDNWSIKKVQEDRSVNDNGLQVFGTVTKTPVATGADLVAYGPFTTSNYLQQPYNTDYSFGTGDFYVMTWVYPLGTSAQYDFMLELNDSSTVNRFYLLRNPNGRVYVPWNTDVAGSNLPTNQWSCVIAQRKSGIGEVYVNGVFKVSNAWTSNNNLTQTGGTFIGIYPGGGVGPNSPAFPLDGKLSLMRIGAGAISAEQIKKMYEDEKVLFQENAKATLYGSSNSVTALAFDDTTNLLHVGTSAGRSDFQGLRRITNTTDAVTTAISARNSLIIEQ